MTLYPTHSSGFTVRLFKNLQSPEYLSNHLHTMLTTCVAVFCAAILGELVYLAAWLAGRLPAASPEIRLVEHHVPTLRHPSASPYQLNSTSSSIPLSLDIPLPSRDSTSCNR